MPNREEPRDGKGGKPPLPKSSGERFSSMPIALPVALLMAAILLVIVLAGMWGLR